MSDTVPRPAVALTSRDAEPHVVIVTVTYNSAELVGPFLSALPAAMDGLTSASVIAVDNSSSDGTPERIRELAPWVTVLDAGVNAGYAAGINVALRHQTARAGVVVANPDAVFAPGSLRKLLDVVESDESVGIAVPAILDGDKRLSYSLRREPTIRRAFGEALLGGGLAGRFAMFGETIRDPSYYVNGAEADWATGAAMLISRRTLDSIGLWSEDYFLYSEETDYALRSRDAGFVLRLVRDAEVVHRGGELSKSPWLWSLQAVNRTRLYKSRHGVVASGVFWCCVVLNEAIRSVLPRPTHRAAVRALFRGHAKLRDMGKSSQG